MTTSLMFSLFSPGHPLHSMRHASVNAVKTFVTSITLLPAVAEATRVVVSLKALKSGKERVCDAPSEAK